MLTIRQTQLNALQQERYEDWEVRLVESLAGCYPDLREDHTPSGFHTFVAAALRAGEELGFSSERDLARYANLACALGPGFASSARYPWASILLAERAMTPTQKMDRLCWWAKRTLKEANYGRR